MTDQQQRRAYVERLADYLGERLMLDPAAILGTTRVFRVAQARMLIMYHLRAQHWEATEIGRVMCRDHSTVSHAFQQIPHRLAMDPDLAKLLRAMPHMGARLFSEPNLVDLYQQLTETLDVAMALRIRIDAVLSQQDIPQRALRAIS